MKLSTLVTTLLFVATPHVQGACEFCPNGLDNPDASTTSFLGGFGFEVNDTSCADVQAGAAVAEDCEGIVQLEPLCCPSTTDQFVCEFCPSGLEIEVSGDGVPDQAFGCALFQFAALAATNETTCSPAKLLEPYCCPSQSEYKLPPVTEGDTCYICGSADVAMKSPDATILSLLAGNDATGDGVEEEDGTCAEAQMEINNDRTENQTCADLLSQFHLTIGPSLCGCEGFSAPNGCKLCEGGIVNRDAKAEGDINCGEAYDVIQHFTPGGCGILQLSGELNVTAIDNACCTYSSSGKAHGPSFVGLLVVGMFGLIMVL